MTVSAPRRRDATQTRARILGAAAAVFSEHSYGEAGIRDVAKLADVNAALVMRYFGSKEQLFEEALDTMLDGRLLEVEGGRTFGQALADRLLKGARTNPLPMLVLASADPVGRERALALLEKHIVEPLAVHLGGPESHARAERVLAICAGFFTYRVLLPLPHLSGPIDESTRAWFASALQAAYDSSTDCEPFAG